MNKIFTNADNMIDVVPEMKTLKVSFHSFQEEWQVIV